MTTVAQGIAASAASVIFMAGDERIMAEGALLMIHDAAGLTMGTEAIHIQAAKVLGKLSNSLAGIYAKGTGRTASVERAAMRAETWLNGAEAVEAGFATAEIDMGRAEASAFNYAMYARAPDFLVRRAKDMAETFGREAAAAMFAAPRQPSKENDMPKIPTPTKATTPDGWKAEYEASDAAVKGSPKNVYLSADDYAAYMTADAKGLIRVLHG